MSVLDAIKDLNNDTAMQQARDAQKAREESVLQASNRNVGSVMGKHDFLMLLSAQLRHQDPLNPQSDSEFASQLAQFSALEQMQNMNETLSAMAGYQAFSLVGKYVIAIAAIDGVLSEIPGVVDSIFTRDGVTFAQIGEYVVPISAITDVFDSNSMVTPEMLIQTSNQLIGRTVIAQVGDNIFEGIVTRITVSGGVMYARIDDGTETGKFVPVGSIFDVRETGTPGNDKPTSPPPALDRPHLIADGDAWIELDGPEGVGIGRWTWDYEEKKWVPEGFVVKDAEGEELGRWVWNEDDAEWLFEEVNPGDEQP